MSMEIEILSSSPAWSEERKKEYRRLCLRWGRKEEVIDYDVVIAEVKFGDYSAVLTFKGTVTGEPVLVKRYEGEELPISQERIEEVRNFLRPHFKEMAQHRKAS